MVNVNDTPTMIVPAPCCLSICIPHSLSSGTAHLSTQTSSSPRNPSSGGLFGNPPERLTWWGIICQRRHIGDWKIRCDDDGDVWAGTRRPDGNGWSLLGNLGITLVCMCVCCVAILLQCHCIAKMINVTNSAASLHHSAAALVICFHCDAREQLQK